MAWSDRVIESGGCSLCNLALKAEVKVTVVTLDANGQLQTAVVPRETYLRVVQNSATALLIQSQRAKARTFRYNRMIYKT